MVRRSVGDILRQYDLGVFTRHEGVGMLVQKAVDTDPEMVASELAPEFLQSIRDLAADPPARREQIMSFSSVCEGPGFDQEEYEARRRRDAALWFDCIWRWHQYFHGDERSAT